MHRDTNHIDVSMHVYPCMQYGTLHISGCSAPTSPHVRGLSCSETLMAASRADLERSITRAASELKLARKDGACEWITKAAKQLDDLLDQLTEGIKA